MAEPATVILGALAAVAFALAAMAVGWLHLQPSDVDPVADGVSAYGVGGLRAWYRFQVIATGVGSLILVIGLARTGGAASAGLAFLVTFAATRIAIAWFPTDLEGPLTPTGQAHVLLAAVAFVSIAVAAPVVSLSLVAAPEWQGLGPLLVPLSFAVSASVVATLASNALPRTRPVFGAVERLFYVAAFTWLLASAGGLVAVGVS